MDTTAGKQVASRELVRWVTDGLLHMRHEISESSSNNDKLTRHVEKSKYSGESSDVRSPTTRHMDRSQDVEVRIVTFEVQFIEQALRRVNYLYFSRHHYHPHNSRRLFPENRATRL